MLLALAAGGMALLVRRRVIAAKTKTIRDWPVHGQQKSHVAEWKGDNFDRYLSAQVGYARRPSPSTNAARTSVA